MKKIIFFEEFVLVLFVFSNSLAYYILYNELIVLVLGIVLSSFILILLLFYYIFHQNPAMMRQALLFPSLYLLTGLCFVFQDPDVIRVFTDLNSESSFLPSLLSLILLIITVGCQVSPNTNIEFANLILGILSFCLTVNHIKTTGRSIYLFLALIAIFFENIKSKVLAKHRLSLKEYQEVHPEKEYDMEFEEITNKLQVCMSLLEEVLKQPGIPTDKIKESLNNIKSVSLCLQKKSNIYSVKINSVTRNMDEQDRMFIKESCFDNELISNELANNYGIKFQPESVYGVTELSGLLKNIGKD